MARSDISPEWCLSSTNGHARLSGALESNLGESLVHDVRLEYYLAVDEPAATIVSVPQLTLSRKGMGELVSALGAWLALPLDGLRNGSFHHEAELADSPAESLILKFGPRDDLIIGAGQVGCLIELRNSSLRSCLPVVTDPTCLRILADGLDRVLSDS